MPSIYMTTYSSYKCVNSRNAIMEMKRMRLSLALLAISAMTSPAMAQDLVMRRPLPNAARDIVSIPDSTPTPTPGPGTEGVSFVATTSCEGGFMDMDGNVIPPTTIFRCEGFHYDATGEFDNSVGGSAEDCSRQAQDGQYAKIRATLQDQANVYGITIHSPSQSTAAEATNGEVCTKPDLQPDHVVHAGQCGTNDDAPTCSALGMRTSGSLSGIVSVTDVPSSECTAASTSAIAAGDLQTMENEGWLPVGNGKDVGDWCKPDSAPDYAVEADCRDGPTRAEYCYLATASGRTWQVSCSTVKTATGLPNSMFTHWSDVEQALGNCEGKVGAGIDMYKNVRPPNGEETPPTAPTFYRYERARMVGEAQQTLTLAYSGINACYGSTQPGQSNDPLSCAYRNDGSGSGNIEFYQTPLYVITQTYTMPYHCKEIFANEIVEMDKGTCKADKDADMALFRQEVLKTNSADSRGGMMYPLYFDNNDHKNNYYYTGVAVSSSVSPLRQTARMVQRPAAPTMTDTGKEVIITSSYYGWLGGFNRAATPNQADMTILEGYARQTIATYEQAWLGGK